VSFRHDAFAAERTGVLVDDRAVAIEMLVEDDVAMSAVQELGSARWSNWNKTARRA
jgi:hypothetical protein